MSLEVLQLYLHWSKQVSCVHRATARHPYRIRWPIVSGLPLPSSDSSTLCDGIVSRNMYLCDSTTLRRDIHNLPLACFFNISLFYFLLFPCCFSAFLSDFSRLSGMRFSPNRLGKYFFAGIFTYAGQCWYGPQVSFNLYDLSVSCPICSLLRSLLFIVPFTLVIFISMHPSSLIFHKQFFVAQPVAVSRICAFNGGRW